MKLFELFEAPVLTSAKNLSAISNAVKAGTGTRIYVGEHALALSARDARFVYRLYEKAIDNGTEDSFLKSLVERTLIAENQETLSHLMNRFPKEVKDFKAGNELDSDLYEALFDYYMMHGEMPYGIAKGREGDPFNWVTERFEQDAGIHEQDIPMEDSFTQEDQDPLDELMAMGMFEGKKPKKAMGEGWEDMVKAAKERSEEKKTGDKWKTSRGEAEKTSTGIIHRRSYDPKTGESDEPKTDGEGKAAEKRGRGRPRKHPVQQDTGPKRGRGRPRKNPAPDPSAPKRPRGRPRKVREWIETLRFIAEGK